MLLTNEKGLSGGDVIFAAAALLLWVQYKDWERGSTSEKTQEPKIETFFDGFPINWVIIRDEGRRYWISSLERVFTRLVMIEKWSSDVTNWLLLVAFLTAETQMIADGKNGNDSFICRGVRVVIFFSKQGIV